jgi:hypothetical protein
MIEYFDNMLPVSVLIFNRRRYGHIIITGVSGITLQRVLWERLAKYCVQRGGGVRSKSIPIRAWIGS